MTSVIENQSNLKNIQSLLTKVIENQSENKRQLSSNKKQNVAIEEGYLELKDSSISSDQQNVEEVSTAVILRSTTDKPYTTGDDVEIEAIETDQEHSPWKSTIYPKCNVERLLVPNAMLSWQVTYSVDFLCICLVRLYNFGEKISYF